MTMPLNLIVFVFGLLRIFGMSRSELNIDKLPSAKDIQNRVNQRYDSLFVRNTKGERSPYVCTICDEFLTTKDNNEQVALVKLKLMKEDFSWTAHPDPRRKTEIEKYFTFSADRNTTGDDISFLDGMALSPRGVLCKKQGRGRKSGFSCCKRCKHNIEKKKLPRHAIVNKNYVGAAPACLKELNEVELAFLSPVKSYGHCFTWQGGKQLKGTLTFMRVQPQKIAYAVTTLEDVGFNDHVLVLFTGRMTTRQKKRAKERSSIRTAKVIAALEWLCANNYRWKDIDLQAMREKLNQVQPRMYDRSREVAEENTNVETQEVFTCYYPDGAANPTNGGFEDPAAFKEYVQKMAEQGFDVEFQANLGQEFVNGSDTDLLVNACLLQFPYGIGGMEERRRLHDGSFTTKSDLVEYLGHLSLMSQVQFQAPLFQLVMYSLLSKFRLLKSSRLQLRGKTDAQNLAQGLNVKDVISCINGKRLKNRNAGTTVSRKFLGAVDATAKSLPHTNEASRMARASGEAMQHHYGMSSLFLTVTFDDENSLLMQVMSGIEIDDDVAVEAMTDAELSKRARRRREIRLDLPGFAALNFEMLFEIVIEEVVGWNLKDNCATDKPGFFGYPYALSYAIEEQGRKTLHTHMTVWISGYKRIQEGYFFGNQRQKEKSSRTLEKYCEHISLTHFFPTIKQEVLRAFDHKCSETNIAKREAPVVVHDQGLRNLRHRKGFKDFEGHFATCPNCKKQWTYEDMVGDYLQNSLQICQVTTDGGDPQGTSSTATIPKARMLGKLVEFQKSDGSVVPEACINATYQHHASCHVPSCFKCQKKSNKKRGHVCGPECECRYRLPDKKRLRAKVLEEEKKIPWYHWKGSHHEQPLAQVLPKRGTYDLFQNVCCPAVSQSKLSCNSNVALILDGPIGQYMHKYQEKENQEEETAEYKEVEAAVKKFGDDRKHEEDRPEALRRICRAAFAHNKTNVISACFASYLIRYDSRFYYSSQFKFCPLKDVVRLHNQQEVRGVLKYTPKGECFFENSALDYLCRGNALKRLCLADFTERYYVVTVTTKNADDIVPFEPDTGHYQHPSVIRSGYNQGSCAKGVLRREEDVKIRVSQWMFPDTACFKADCLTCPYSDFTRKMEEYAQLVLSLFMPHRSHEDLKAVGAEDYPYLRKMRDIYEYEERGKQRGQNPIVFTKRNVQFLQNVQNCRCNTLRYKTKGDELSRLTEPYVSPNTQDADDDGDNDDNPVELEETAYELFAQAIEADVGQPPATDRDQSFLNETLQNLDFGHMKDKGKYECGYTDDLEAIQLEHPSVPIVKVNGRPPNVGTNTANDDYPDERPKYTVNDIVRIHLNRSTPKTAKEVFEDKTIHVSSATGTIKSIMEWGKAAFESDEKQRRAFEVLISSFLLTFYEETPEYASDATMEAGPTRAKYRKAQRALKLLRGRPGKKNLICLLHGPGGSGKSTVINMVKAYARDYCRMLNHPITNRTIITTAMSGVAATLLNGETTHSVVGLNRNTVQQEEVEQWVDARLLIVDECSFASHADFQKMHEHLKLFMEDFYTKFGGLNVIFAGDFSQLEPVKKDPIYKDDNYCPEFQGSVNCYIKLNGKWRFMDDPHYGDIMSRMRSGNPTTEDINEINAKCLDKVPPAGIQVASYTNRDRDAINAAIFDDFTRANKPEDGSVLEAACLIFMDNLYMNDSAKTPVPVQSNAVKRHFYEHCTESECNHGNSGRGRVDPVLKIYTGCPLMLTENSDVSNGEANGSRVFAKGVRMKRGEQPFLLKLDNGCTVKAMYASQVEAIEVEHENEDISPRVFDVKSETFSFMCKMTFGTEELYSKVKGTAFPVISNSCTTGHKLQGCTVENILVNDWYYGANWAYVVLSRVKTMAGLYLRRPLSLDLSKYAKPEAMKRMLKTFEENVAVEMLTEEQYAEIETMSEIVEVHVGNARGRDGPLAGTIAPF